MSNADLIAEAVERLLFLQMTGPEAKALETVLTALRAAEAREQKLREALVSEREENLWNAYHVGIERDGKWMTGCMSDAEWLERECGLDPVVGWHDAKHVQSLIPVAARRALGGEG